LDQLRENGATELVAALPAGVMVKLFDEKSLKELVLHVRSEVLGGTPALICT
jgi:hypothetical protein